MLISTKGKYALTVLVDIAEHNQDDSITLKSVAQRQELSEKYLEAIIHLLVKGGVVVGTRGKNGGYKLAKAPDQISVYDVLILTENSITPVSCVGCQSDCAKIHSCRTFPLWKEFDDMVYKFFTSYTIADLMRSDDPSDNYII